MKKLIIVIILIIPFVLTADIISQITCGGQFNDSGRKFCLNGNEILIAGYTFSAGNGRSDFYLSSTDISGNLNWERTFGGSGWDYAMDICKTVENDGYILFGFTTSEGNGSMDYLMIKTDLEGNEVWSKTFGGVGSDIGTALCYSSTGGYFLCGYTNSYGSGEDDVYIIETDTSGNELWSQTYGSVKSETAHDIEPTADGNLIIAGSTGRHDWPGASGRNRDMYFLKIDEAGNVLAENEVWIISGQQGSYDMCYSVLTAPDGGFYALGNSSQEGNEVMDIALLKMDEMLTEEWKRNYAVETIYDYGYAIGGITADSCLYITGTYNSSQFAGNSIYFKLLDLEGNEKAGEEYELGSPASAYDIIETDSGNFLLCGHLATQNGSYDLLQLHISGLQVDFSSSAETGHFPLEVSFQDETYGNPMNWNWDFDNDGVVDSQEQHPSYTYNEPGTYTVSLEVSDQFVTKTVLKEDYVRVFDGESALQFDMINSYVSVPANESIDLTAAFTLEAWIYPYGWGDTPAFGGRIIDKSSYGVYLCESHPALNDHCLGLSLKTSETPISLSASEENSILLNAWQHVAVSYDGSSEVKIYINGIQNDVTQLNPPADALLDNSTIDLVLGKSSDLSWAFDGIIDEVRIWNTVRSEADIVAHMQSWLTGNENGLVAYWKMNEGWGLEILDGSDNDNNGQIHQANWIQGNPFEPTAADDEYIPANSGIFNLINYPNPFNPVTTISFTSSESTEIKDISIYNIKGQITKKLSPNLCHPSDAGNSPEFIERQGKFEYSITWDGTDNYNNPVPSGIYFYKISTSNCNKTNKMILLK